jgi:tetratricopeptide (TPR) repeat protein
MKLARALAFERSERYQAAIREYQSILYMDRTVQVARFKLAALYKRVGRTQEATELMQEGATLSMFPARWKNN